MIPPGTHPNCLSVLYHISELFYVFSIILLCRINSDLARVKVVLANVTFTNGVGVYTDSFIKATSIVFAQRQWSGAGINNNWIGSLAISNGSVKLCMGSVSGDYSVSTTIGLLIYTP